MNNYPNGPYPPQPGPDPYTQYPPQSGYLPPAQPQYPPPGYPQMPPQQPMRPPKKPMSGWAIAGIIIGAIILFVAIGSIANGNTGTDEQSSSVVSSTTDTSNNADPTQVSSPVPAQPPKPASRATIDQIEKELSAPEDPIVENYNEQTGELKVAEQFGWAVDVTQEIVKNIARDHMKGYFDTHKDANVSSVTVTIYQYSKSSSGYISIARATMSRSTAQSIGWFFADRNTVWDKCTNTWIDPSIV